MLTRTATALHQVNSTEISPNEGEFPCGSLLGRNERWYCWKAKPGQQIRAWIELSRQDFTVFAPIHVAERHGNEEILKPLFGNYAFVAFDRSDPRWRVIHSTPGISSLMSADALNPIAIPRGIVEALIARRREIDGIIDDILPATVDAIRNAKQWVSLSDYKPQARN